MKRKILNTLIIVLIFILTSCNNRQDNCLRNFHNEYNTYEEMVDDYQNLKDLGYSDNFDSRNIIFKNVEVKKTSYHISGLDYCTVGKDRERYDGHDPNHCSNLHARQMFILYELSDDSKFAITFFNKRETHSSNTWEQVHIARIGGPYDYDYGVNFQDGSYLYNENGEELLRITYTNVSDELKKVIMQEAGAYFEN